MTSPPRGGPLDWEAREGNYDTSDVRTVLSRLQRGRPPAGAEVLELAKKDASTSGSGFFDRLLEEHFSGGSGMFPRRLKDVTKSLFGVPGQEDTITWGQNVDMSLPIFTSTADVIAFASRPLPQTVHVHRDHPTTFSVLAVVDYGAGFTATVGENIGIELQYTVGVGQQRAIVKHKLPILADTALSNGAQQTDQFVNVPLQALQVAARVYDFTFSGAESPPRTITLTVLAAPVVY